MAKELQIRNSTAEFLIFQAEDKAEGVQVFYKDETIWASQKAIAALFDCSTDNVSLHLKNIFESGELDKNSVTEKISATASDGKKYEAFNARRKALAAAEAEQTERELLAIEEKIEGRGNE